jgi:hypothetical protein
MCTSTSNYITLNNTTWGHFDTHIAEGVHGDIDMVKILCLARLSQQEKTASYLLLNYLSKSLKSLKHDHVIVEHTSVYLNPK